MFSRHNLVPLSSTCISIIVFFFVLSRQPPRTHRSFRRPFSFIIRTTFSFLTSQTTSSSPASFFSGQPYIPTADQRTTFLLLFSVSPAPLATTTPHCYAPNHHLLPYNFRRTTRLSPPPRRVCLSPSSPSFPAKTGARNRSRPPPPLQLRPTIFPLLDDHDITTPHRLLLLVSFEYSNNKTGDSGVILQACAV
jgi:hypothetical protein